MSRIPEELLKKLDAPYTQSCYKKYFANGMTLTSLKAGAILGRLHDVFGRGNVVVTDTCPPRDRLVILPDGRTIVNYSGTLTIKFTKFNQVDEDEITFSISGMDLVPSKEETSKEKPGKGLHTNGQLVEDVWKGCRTNAISKALFENLGVGSKMFMGLMVFEGNEVIEYEGNDNFPSKRPGSPGAPERDRDRDIAPERNPEAPTAKPQIQVVQPKSPPAVSAPILHQVRTPKAKALDFAKANREAYLPFLEANGMKGKRILDMNDQDFAALNALMINTFPEYASEYGGSK